MKATITLEKIYVRNEGDPSSARGEPYLWTFFFQFDTSSNLSTKFGLYTTPNISHGNLGGGVNTGDIIIIPEAVGKHTFELHNNEIFNSKRTLVGCLIVLLEEDDTPGPNAELLYVEVASKIANELGIKQQKLIRFSEDYELNVTNIEHEIESLIKSMLSVEGFNDDDFIGHRLIVMTLEELIARPQQTFNCSWNSRTGSEDGSFDLTGKIENNNLPQSVVIYEHVDYQGQYQVFYQTPSKSGAGNYNLEDITIENDTISSLIVPVGWQITLYAEADFVGDKIVLNEDTSMLPSYFNDRVSSLIIEGPVTIFSDRDYQGNSQVLGVGRYNMDDITISNDELSSLRIPRGKMAKLYKDINFAGASQAFIDDVPLITHFFNDKTSSIIIEDTIVIFKDANFVGESKVLMPGRYTGTLLGLDNVISSIKVPRDKKVTVFKNADFTGTSAIYDEHTPYVGNSFNDKISSVIVEYR